MRIVALEEHFSVPAVASRIPKDVMHRRGFRPRNLTPGAPNPMELLPEFAEKRLKSMDDAGITVQVLSNAGPGPDLMPGPDGIAPRARSTIIWRRKSRAIPTASPASPHCRCKAPMPVRSSSSAR